MVVASCMKIRAITRATRVRNKIRMYFFVRETVSSLCSLSIAFIIITSG